MFWGVVLSSISVKLGGLGRLEGGGRSGGGDVIVLDAAFENDDVACQGTTVTGNWLKAAAGSPYLERTSDGGGM